MNYKKSKTNIKYNRFKSLNKKQIKFNNTFTENLTEDIPYIKETLNSFDIFEKFLTKENDRHYALENDNPKSKNRTDIMPDYSNLTKEIIDKKNKFRNYFNIKNSIFKEIQSQNSTIIKSFKKGCISYFFGPNGIVTNQYNPLKKYYDERARGLELNKKIFSGRLDYYDLATHDSYSNRLNFSREKLLCISNNLMVIHSDFEKINKKILERKEKSNKNFVYLNIKKIKDCEKLSKKDLKKIANDNKIKTKKIRVKLKQFSTKTFIKNIPIKLNRIKTNSLGKSSPIKEIINDINLNKSKEIIKNRNNLRNKIIEKNSSIQKTDSLPFFYMTSINKENNKLYNTSDQLLKKNSLFSFNNKMKIKLQKELKSIYSFNNDLKKYVKNYNKTFSNSFFAKKPKKTLEDKYLYEDLEEIESKKEVVFTFNKIELPKRIKHLLEKK